MLIIKGKNLSSYPETLIKEVKPAEAIMHLLSYLSHMPKTVQCWRQSVTIRGPKYLGDCAPLDVEIFGPADEMVPIFHCINELAAETKEDAALRPGQSVRVSAWNILGWRNWLDPDDQTAALELYVEQPGRLSLLEAFDLAA